MPTLSQLAYIPITWGVPCEEARFGKCIFLGQLDLTLGPYVYDPSQSPQTADMKIQSIYIDNAVTGNTRVHVSGTNWMVRIPIYKLGFFPLLCGDRPVFTITSEAASSPTRIYLTTLPITGYMYPIDKFTGGI